MGALPIPPSILDWGDAIRTPNGVYQSQFDFRQAQPTPFTFAPDSPPDEYMRLALQLPEVQLYWTFARFPVIRSYSEDGQHFVEFSEDRFVNGRKGTRSPFTYLVEFDAGGNLVEQGFQTNAMSLREIEHVQPPPRRDTP